MASVQQPAATLPDPKTAFDTLFNAVHARAFFGRVAQRGYSPQNEKQASELLALANELRATEQHPQFQKAAETNDPFARARTGLNRLLEQHGVKSAVDTQAREVAVKNAAAGLAADPEIYNAVLSLKAAEAANTAKALGLVQ